MLNLLRLNDEVFLDFAFGDNLFLLHAGDFHIAIHLNLAFLDSLFLSDARFLNLLLHLVFAFLDTLVHFVLELEGFCLSFSGDEGDIPLLV